MLDFPTISPVSEERMRIRRIAANDFKQLQSIDLTLPRVGRFLVQGRNEAGKSTLFEALYYGLFGKGLVGRSGEDYIGYGREKARVEVWIETSEALFKIERTLTRGKNQSALVTIERADRAPEIITGATAVARSIEHALKIDGDALLNTCFVEQKKLDKLEGVDRAKREESLARLLNIDNLKTLADTCKVSAEDRERVQRLKQRYDLALARDELPEVEGKLRAVEERLILAQAQAALGRTLAEHQARDAQAAEARRLKARQAELAEQRREVERITAAGTALRLLRDHLVRIEETRQRHRDLAEQIAERRVVVAGLPQVEARATLLRRLDQRWQRLERVTRRAEMLEAEAAQREREAGVLRQRSDDLARTRARLGGLVAEAAAAEQALRHAEAAQTAWREHETLTAWREAYHAATSVQRAETELDELRREREAVRAEFERWQAALLVRPPDAATVARLAEVFDAIERVAGRIGFLEGSAETRREQAVIDRQRLDAVTRRLAEAKMSAPADEDAAAVRLAALDVIIAGRDRQTLQTAANVARDALAAARGQRDEVARQVQATPGDLAQQAEMAATQAAAARRQADKAANVGRRWLPAITSTLATIGVDSRGLGRAALEAEVAARDLARQAADCAGWEREAADREAALVALELALGEMQRNAEEVVPDLPALTADASLATLDSYLDALRGSWQRGDPRQLQLDFEAVVAAIGRAQEASDQAETRRAAAFDEAGRWLRQARLQGLIPDAQLATVQAAHDQLAVYGLDGARLAEERDGLRDRVRTLRDWRDRLETQLGIGDQGLDSGTCEVEWAAASRDLLVRGRAREMLDAARKRIVEKVMPHTMDHMAAILPQLTSGRYILADLTDDYKIKVWDERAGDGGGWRQKDIFSGGARDQLSLALRLSFALATLPAERGTAPSFIFLDEPLGAFDDERSAALLRLLTEGEISKAFDQIFLISHVRVDPSLFTYRIVMDGGRVAEHDLPDSSESPRPAEAMPVSM